jgi:hypothetical protein
MIFAWSGLGLGGLLLQACDYLHELTTGEAQMYTADGDPAIDPALEFERDITGQAEAS